MDTLNKLKELYQSNPELFKMDEPKAPAVKSKKQKAEPGNTIEIPESMLPNKEEPIPISIAQARKLLKQTRKPRVLSEEAKAKMLANLQKGRETLKRKKEETSQATKTYVEEQKKAVLPSVPVKKYVIKERQSKKAKKEEGEDLEYEVQKNEQLLKRIQEMQQQLKQRVPPPPPLRRQSPSFRLFY
jgi:hypothetical protein